jgi:hypothetical protein
MNHSLINASRNTHAKIALLAFAVAMVFVAALSGFGSTRLDPGARAHGPVVKATTTVNVARSGASAVR